MNNKFEGNLVFGALLQSSKYRRVGIGVRPSGDDHDHGGGLLRRKGYGEEIVIPSHSDKM